MLLRSVLIFGCVLTFAGALRAQEPAANKPCLELDCVVAKRGTAVITVADVTAKVKVLDPHLQKALFSDPKQMNKMLEDMLTRRQIANEVDPLEVQKDVLLQARLKQSYDDVVTVYKLNQMRAERVTGTFEQLARENYLTNLDAMKLPREVSVRHLLVSYRQHGEAAALERAKELRAQLADANQERFQEMVLEHSDDPAKTQDAGLIKLSEDTQNIDGEFLDGALALDKVGSISQPIHSQFGYHLIQLIEDTPGRVVPFEEAKDRIIAKLRNEAETRATIEYRNEVAAKGKTEFYPQNLERVIAGDDSKAAN